MFEYDLTPLMRQTPSDVYTLKVALPEGATVLSANIDGFQPHEVKEEVTYSYLDYFGRPTLVYTFKRHLTTPGREDKVRVHYRLPSVYMAVSPSYTVCLLLASFAVYLILSKADFTFGQYDGDVKTKMN